MATALQCPACGFKHRLDAVGDVAVFPCASCSRQLKLPAQYRDGSAARPGAASGSGAPAAGVPRTQRVPVSVRARQFGAADEMRLPLRILAWVIAFVISAFAVRMLAKWTGFVDANTFVDLMLDNSVATYARLAILVPVWALFATALATLFIEVPGWWSRRSVTVARPKPAPPRAAAANVGTAAVVARPRPVRPTEAGAPAPTGDQRPRRIPRRDTGS